MRIKTSEWNCTENEENKYRPYDMKDKKEKHIKYHKMNAVNENRTQHKIRNATARE